MKEYKIKEKYIVKLEKLYNEVEKKQKQEKEKEKDDNNKHRSNC
jgi:hypothetical protein